MQSSTDVPRIQPQQTPPANSKDTSSTGFFQRMKNAVVSSNFAASAVDKLSSSYIEDDMRFLSQLTNTKDISSALQQIAPQLPLALETLLPGIVADFASHHKGSTLKVAEALIIHLIANHATKLYPDQAEAFKEKQTIYETISLETLTHDISNDVLYLFAKGYNEIDETIQTKEDITEDKFIPLTNAIIDLFFPAKASKLVVRLADKAIKKFLVKELPGILKQVYEPFGMWLNGEKVELDKVTLGETNLTELIPIVEAFVAYVTNCMSDSYREKDTDYLVRLTGVDTIHNLVAQIGPQLFNLILESDDIGKFLGSLAIQAPEIVKRNKDTIGNVGTSVILKIIANIARDIFEDEEEIVPIEEFVTRFAMGVSNLFGNHIRKINQTKNPTVEDFQELAEQLIVIMLPKDPVVLSFVERRKMKLTEGLCVVLKKSYDSIVPREDTKIYKQTLREVLWCPAELQSKSPLNDPLPKIPTKELSKEFGVEKLVNQLFNVCHNLTSLGREFVAKELSIPAELQDLLHEVLEVFNISKDNLSGIALGISNLINMSHKVSSSDVIVQCLMKIEWQVEFDTELSGDLIAAIAARVDERSDTCILSHPKIVCAQLVDVEGFSDIPHLMKKRIANEIITAMYADKPLYWITPTLQNALQLTLFKGLVHVLEKAKSVSKNRQELFPNALQIVLEACVSELPLISECIRRVSDPKAKEYIPDEEEKKVKIEEIFDPFIDKMIAIFYEDVEGETKFEDHIPLPNEIKPFVAKLIRDKAPKLIVPIFKAFTSWIDAKEYNKDRLDAIFNNRHASEACRIVGALTSQAIPYCLQEFHTTLTDDIGRNFAGLFADLDGRKPLKKDLKALLKMVDHTLVSLSTNNSPAMQALFGFIQHFAETAFLRCFADLAECLAQMDVDHKEDEEGTLLVQGGRAFLGEMQEHLSLIAELKSDIKQFRAGKVPHDDLIEKFREGNHLHEALEDPAEKILFFQNLAKKFFKLVGVRKDIMPIPNFLKNAVWEVLEDDLAPIVLETLFDHACSPHTFNLVLKSLFEQINIATGNIDGNNEEQILLHYEDDPQNDIDEKSAKFVKSLVDMQPTSIAKWALKSKKVKTLAGQAIGQPLRGVLEERSMITLLDELIISLVPSIHPGEWKPNGEFRCLKATKKGLRPTLPEFSHLFPRTEKAKKACEKLRVKEAKQAEKAVVEEITHTIENQTKYIFLGFLRRVWTQVKHYIHLVINKIAGKYAKSINKFIDTVLDGIYYYLIRPTLFVTTYPILIIVRRLLRFYFVHQSTRRAEDVKHEIHENIFYRLIDELFEIVGRAKNEPAPAN